MILRGQCNGAQVLSRSYGFLHDFDHVGAVEERRWCSEAAVETSRGALSSENAGMSNERGVRNPSAESPRVPGEG